MLERDGAPNLSFTNEVGMHDVIVDEASTNEANTDPNKRATTQSCLGQKGRSQEQVGSVRLNRAKTGKAEHQFRLLERLATLTLLLQPRSCERSS